MPTQIITIIDVTVLTIVYCTLYYLSLKPSGGSKMPSQLKNYFVISTISIVSNMLYLGMSWYLIVLYREILIRLSFNGSYVNTVIILYLTLYIVILLSYLLSGSYSFFFCIFVGLFLMYKIFIEHSATVLEYLTMTSLIGKAKYREFYDFSNHIFIMAIIINIMNFITLIFRNKIRRLFIRNSEWSAINS